MYQYDEKMLLSEALNSQLKTHQNAPAAGRAVPRVICYIADIYSNLPDSIGWGNTPSISHPPRRRWRIKLSVGPINIFRLHGCTVYNA